MNDRILDEISRTTPRRGIGGDGRTSPMDGALTDLHVQLDRLEEITAMLEGRLTPLSAPRAAAGGTRERPEGGPMPAASPIVDAVITSSRRVLTVANRIGLTLELLEV